MIRAGREPASYGLRMANAHWSISIIEPRRSPALTPLGNQRLIGRIAPDSGRIVELRVFPGFQKGTLAASHRRAVSAS